MFTEYILFNYFCKKGLFLVGSTSPLFWLFTVYRSAHFPEVKLDYTNRFGNLLDPFEGVRVTVAFFRMGSPAQRRSFHTQA